MRRILGIITVVLMVATAFAHAQTVPPLINYQGRLIIENGNPQTGQKKLEFNIYDAATDGNLIWGPQVFDPVYLIDGRFNVILGTTDTTGRSIADAFGGNERFIGITMDDGAEISPRQQILSVPYAVRTHFEIPVGGVILWWGNSGDIPENFEICDGNPPTTEGAILQDNKPNLSDVFVKGAAESDNAVTDLETGGKHYYTLSINEMPEHHHNQQVSNVSGYGGTDGAPSGTGYDGAYHGTTVTHKRGGSQPFDNRPAFQEMFYIIRVK